MTGPKLVEGKVPLSLAEMLGASRRRESQSPREEDKRNAPKSFFQPYHSRTVPKPEKLEANASKCAERGSPVRTMMLRNIPNKYVQNTLLEEIDNLGFVGTYDFFYLPMDVHNRSNVGYAFINFMCPADAERFRRVFYEHRFQRFQSRKVSSVCSAHVQGLDENLRHFENRAVTHARNDQYRPIVLSRNRRIDFEEAVAEVKARAAEAEQTAAVEKCTNQRRTEALEQEAVDRCELGSARKGLEHAIRSLLTSLPVDDFKGGLAKPPGLEPQAAANDKAAVHFHSNDVEQLLLLRNMLVQRLVEKEDKARFLSANFLKPAELSAQFGAFGSLNGMKPWSWEEPSYISLPPYSQFCGHTRSEEERWRAMPSTLGAPHRLSAEEAKYLLSRTIFTMYE